jgi:tetratricopeptide (TPR) repeat protein
MSQYRHIFIVLLIPLSFLTAQDIDEAIRLFNTSQFDKAQELFIEIIKDETNPRITEAYYYLGRLSIRQDTAIMYYNKVINSYPQSRYADIAHLEIAKSNIARKKYKNSIVTLNELLRKYPDTEHRDEVLFWLGVSYISTGMEEQGIAMLKDLRSTFPQSVWSERALTIIPGNGPDTPPPSEEYYTVQVGSYRNKSNADNYAAQLREKGYEVQVVEALVKGNTYWRVWVGKYPSIEEAKAFSLTLESAGIKGNVVKGY